MSNKINIFKKINRNAFNEKLIHRYLFERYYFGDSRQRKSLLPEILHKNQINLIVPEDSKNEDGYRADLTIYFKDKEKGVPVEVKWSLLDFKKKNQIDYIRKENGFVVVLGGSEFAEIEGINVIQINHDDFANWVAENISRLSRETLIYRAKSEVLSYKTQQWVVFLKGGANGPAYRNFQRMLKEKSTYPFWAFRQNSSALPNILEMQKGDKIFFIFASGGTGMGHSKSKKTKIKVHKYFLCEIVEPYYMALDNKRGVFFEASDNLQIGDRKWPHFVDFDIKHSYEGLIELDFGPQAEFAEVFANSANHGGGTPYPLIRSSFEKLKDYLRKLEEF